MTDFVDHRPGLAKRQPYAFQTDKSGMSEGTVLFGIGPFSARPVSAVSTPEAPGILKLAIGSPAAMIALICICLQLTVCFW